MAKAFGPTIKKLQQAINKKFDARILINKTQFFSKETDKPVEILVIKKAIWNEEQNKFKNIELFSSPSDIQIVLWLRDYWYELNGMKIPTDNEEWNKAKALYIAKHQVKEEQKNGEQRT